MHKGRLTSQTRRWRYLPHSAQMACVMRESCPFDGSTTFYDSIGAKAPSGSDDTRHKDGGHLLLVALPVGAVLDGAEVVVAHRAVDKEDEEVG